jgi:hypothetical protein
MNLENELAQKVEQMRLKKLVDELMSKRDVLRREIE